MTTTTPSTTRDFFTRLYCGLLYSHECSETADPLRLCLMPARFITDATDPTWSNENQWRNTPPTFPTLTTTTA